MQAAQRMTQKLSLSSTFFSFSSESVSPLFKGLEAHCQAALNILSSSDQGVNSNININLILILIILMHHRAEQRR